MARYGKVQGSNGKKSKFSLKGLTFANLSEKSVFEKIEAKNDFLEERKKNCKKSNLHFSHFVPTTHQYSFLGHIWELPFNYNFFL